MNTISEGKCVVLKGFGGYEMLQIEEMPSQSLLLPNQIRVQVKACGVNFADIYQRQGLLVNMPKPPFVMGMECAGLVIDVGNEVISFKIGDRVICYSPDGGLYAERVVLPVERCFRIPYSMTFDEAAAFLVNYLTAYFALFDLGNLQKGQTVFTHAIAGGVGFAVTQLAKTVENVQIFGTASLGKADAACANGATKVFAYESFHEDISKHCPKGVNIFIDNLSGKEFSKSFVNLSSFGKLIHIGANSVITGEKRNLFSLMRAFMGLKNVSVLELVNNNHSVCGLHLTNLWKSDQEKLVATVGKLCTLFETNLIKPHIDSAWSFNQLTDAMERIANRVNVGKVILRP